MNDSCCNVLSLSRLNDLTKLLYNSTFCRNLSPCKTLRSARGRERIDCRFISAATAQVPIIYRLYGGQCPLPVYEVVLYIHTYPSSIPRGLKTFYITYRLFHRLILYVHNVSEPILFEERLSANCTTNVDRDCTFPNTHREPPIRLVTHSC